MVQKDKIISVLKTYWYAPVILLLVSIIGIMGTIGTIVDRNSKKEIKQLHIENKQLETSLVGIRDSIEILHKAALTAKDKDTVLINKILYIKNQANEQINHFNNLPDSAQYSVFSDLTEEYINTRFDSINY